MKQLHISDRDLLVLHVYMLHQDSCAHINVRLQKENLVVQSTLYTTYAHMFTFYTGIYICDHKYVKLQKNVIWYNMLVQTLYTTYEQGYSMFVYIFLVCVFVHIFLGVCLFTFSLATVCLHLPGSTHCARGAANPVFGTAAL